METPVRAVSRVRPFLDGETSDSKEGDHASDVAVAPTASQLILGQDNFCDFDAVFGADVSQKELYTACLEDLVQHFWQGYNVSVVGYGGHNSGKTYSITGPGFLWAMNEEEFGLLPRAVRQLYRNIADSSGSDEGLAEVRVSVSYLLLCGDAVYDLLTAQSGLIPLPVLSDHRGSVMVPGLSSVDCNSITEVLNCLEAGLLARHNHCLPGGDGPSRDVDGGLGGISNQSDGRGLVGSSLSEEVSADLNGCCKSEEEHPNSLDKDPNCVPDHAREGGLMALQANSHASFTITLQQRKLANDGKPFIVCSRLNFVDLGGLEERLTTSGVLGPLSGLPNGCLARPANLDPSAVGSSDSNMYSATNVLGGVSELISGPGDAVGTDAKFSAANQSTVHEVPVTTNSLDRLYRKDANNGDALLRRSTSDARNDFLKRRLSAELDAMCKSDALEDGDDGTVSADAKAGSVVMTGDHQCLAEVIRCLVNRNRVGPVPYSRCMLTQLLKESLGGNCLTLLVCCASPRREDLPATLLAMKYGGLARYIINRPCINDITSEVAALLADTQAITGSGGAAVVQSLLGEPRGAHVADADVSTAPAPCANLNNDPGSIQGNTDVHSGTNTNNAASTNTSHVQQSAFRQALSPEEVFRLQFGSNQLQQLVDAADGILRSCLPFLPVALQTQAGVWLCRRSETAHCLGGPITASQYVGVSQHCDVAAGSPHVLAGYPAFGGPFYHDGRYWGPVNQAYPGLLGRDDRTLHVIEELSEPGDLKTSSRNTSSAAAAAAPNAAAYSDAGSSCNSCSSSSTSSLGEEFHEQLAVLITSFGDQTCRLVGAVQDRLDVFSEFMTSADASSEEDDPMGAKDGASLEKMDTERSLSSLDQEKETSKTSAPSLKETAVEGGDGGANSYQDLHGDLLSDGSSVDEKLSSNSGEDSDMDMDSCESESSSASEDAAEEEMPDAGSAHRRRNASCAGGGEGAAQQLWLAGTCTSAVALHVREANKRRQRELTETIREKECQLRSMQRGAAEKEELLRQNRDKLLALQRVIDRDTIQLAQAERRVQSCRSSAATAAVQQLRQALQQYRHRASAIDSFSNIIEATKTPVEEVSKVAARVQQLRSELEELHTLVRTGEQRQQQLQRLATHRTRKPQADMRTAASEDDRTGGGSMVESQQNTRDVPPLSPAERPVHLTSPDDKFTPYDAQDVSMKSASATSAKNENGSCTVDGRSWCKNDFQSSVPLDSGGCNKENCVNASDVDGNCRSSACNGVNGSTAKAKVDSCTGAHENSLPNAAHDHASAKTSNVSSPSNVIKGADLSSLGRSKAVTTRATPKSRTKAVVSVQGLSQPHKRRLVTSSSEHCTSSGEGDGGDPALQTARLRQEIAALRDARDALVEYRQRLNKKIQKGMHRQSRRWEAERRFMEVDEAVEAVDSSIEYKNELICGRTEEFAASSTLLLRGKLLDRLLNLSLEELRTLLVRYFSRVIDIRIEFRKQEIAYTELELQFEDQSRLLQKLEWSYEQASLDMERRCAVQQRHFLHYLHKLFRHIDAQETSMQAARETAVPFTPLGPTGDAGLDKSGPTEGDVRQLEMSLYYYKQQCQQLKNLVRQQQGLGYDFQPLYQQLQQQQHRQLPPRQPGEDTNKHKPEPSKRAGISLKLATLGPGASLFDHTRESRSQVQTQAIVTAPESPALLQPTGHYASATPGPSRHGDHHASVLGTRDQNPLHLHDLNHAESSTHNQDPSLPDGCDRQASVAGGHDKNPFSRNARPQPRLRHRRPPASRSSKYREWTTPKRADHGVDDVENIALRPLNSQRSAAVAADLHNSRAVPSKWR